MQKTGHRKKVQNDDMHMDSQRLAHMHTAVRSAMEAKAIVTLFDEFETQANGAKRFHNWLGGTSLILLIAALEFGVFKLIAERIGGSIPEGLFTGMLIVGISPFVLVVISHSPESTMIGC